MEPGDALPLCRHVHQDCQNLRFAGLMTIGMADYTSRPENFQVGIGGPPHGCHVLSCAQVPCWTCVVNETLRRPGHQGACTEALCDCVHRPWQP